MPPTLKPPHRPGGHLRPIPSDSTASPASLAVPALAVTGTLVRMTLTPKDEAWLQRLLEKAPPLSERQRDIIAAAFHGAFTKDDKPAGGRPTN